jgi:hypothetical protein
MGTDVRYIILSDLHFGAQNSLLTELKDGTTLADVQGSSTVMTSLVDCLRALVAGNSGGRRPTLIAAGDLVELSLASASLAMPVVAQLVAALTDRDPVVDREIIFLPGNHDHHLWELSREKEAIDFVKSGASIAKSPVSWHTSSMFLDSEPVFDAPLLEETLDQISGDNDVDLRVFYPDLALMSEDGERTVLVTHGHYMESVATLFSAMVRLFDASAPPLDDVDVIERENWAWVEFFWGTMGRTSRTGALIERLYDSMQDRRAVEAMLAGLAVNITRRKPVVVRKAESWAIRHVVADLVASRLTERERGQAQTVLGEGSRNGLKNYFVALRRAFDRQWDGPLPSDVSVVVGHTHKPFSEWWEDREWPSGGMRVFNTGGWVVDRVAPQPLMGGAVVLVSDELDVCSLRIYQQLEDPTAWEMTVETIKPTKTGEAFARHVRELVKQGDEPWSTFVSETRRLVIERREVMRDILEGDLKLLRE